jgi:hypothetical protein
MLVHTARGQPPRVVRAGIRLLKLYLTVVKMYCKLVIFQTYRFFAKRLKHRAPYLSQQE